MLFEPLFPVDHESAGLCLLKNLGLIIVLSGKPALLALGCLDEVYFDVSKTLLQSSISLCQASFEKVTPSTGKMLQRPCAGSTVSRLIQGMSLGRPNASIYRDDVSYPLKCIPSLSTNTQTESQPSSYLNFLKIANLSRMADGGAVGHQHHLVLASKVRTHLRSVRKSYVTHVLKLSFKKSAEVGC